jgi:hypothetical protein
MRIVKRTVLYAFVLVALTAALLVCKEPKKSQPFSLQAISASVPCHLGGADGVEGRETMAALGQPYRYLGSGGQCYVFVSEDDQYVIKFFKKKAFAIPQWIERFPLQFLVQGLKKKKMQKKGAQRGRVFEAFRFSLDHLSEETEILYVHLTQTSVLNRTLMVRDGSGIVHELPMDALEFVIQRKAEVAFARIDRLMRAGAEDGAREAIEQLLELNLSLYQRGFYNRDPNMRSNYGFIGSKPILIDVGRVVRREALKEPAVFKQALLKSTRRFRKYLTLNHPQLLVHFDNCIAKILSTDHNGYHEIAL